MPGDRTQPEKDRSGRDRANGPGDDTAHGQGDSSGDGPANGTVVLPAILDMRGAWDLHAQLSAAVERGGDVRIDASAVDRISTPCVQVFLGAARTVERLGTGHGLRVIAASAAFQNAFADLGFAARIDEWSETR